jgi:hypothetical protein
VVTIVLDAKIFVGATGVVRGCQNKGTKGLLPTWTTLADDRRHSRSREQTILSDPKALDTVRDSHLDNDLDHF